jgi:hypothetical protein
MFPCITGNKVNILVFTLRAKDSVKHRLVQCLLVFWAPDLKKANIKVFSLFLQIYIICQSLFLFVC